MVESDCRVKSLNAVNINDNIVDNLLQQLGNGDLRTQVLVPLVNKLCYRSFANNVSPYKY